MKGGLSFVSGSEPTGQVNGDGYPILRGMIAALDTATGDLLWADFPLSGSRTIGPSPP